MHDEKVYFYATRGPDGEFASLAAMVVGDGASTWRWIPNFGEWVGDDGVDRLLSNYKDARDFEEVSAEIAQKLVCSLPRYDGRRYGMILKRFELEPRRRSNAELGLDIETKAKRPTSDKQLVATVRNAPLGTWVTMRTFPPTGGTAARQWASEVRRGKKKRLADLGPLETRVMRLLDGSLEVHVRRPVVGPALVETARQLATQAHGAQKDKAGNPYIDHPRRVAERLEAAGASAQAVAAGWLHDVLEDTPTTAADLAAVGIPTEVIDAVTAVTKRPGEPTEDYAARVRASALGLQVKEADLADNCDPARMALLDENTRERLTSKYRRMSALLHPESAPRTS